MSSALENGEVTAEALAEARQQIHELRTLLEASERRAKGLILQLEAAKKDREERALQREEREETEVLHKLWKHGTGRRRELHAADRERMGNAIRKLGFPLCLRAVMGAIYDPNVSPPRRNGRRETFDDLELIFREYAKVHQFADRAPVDWRPSAQEVARIAEVSEEWVRARCSVREDFPS